MTVQKVSNVPCQVDQVSCASRAHQVCIVSRWHTLERPLPHVRWQLAREARSGVIPGVDRYCPLSWRHERSRLAAPPPHAGARASARSTACSAATRFGYVVRQEPSAAAARRPRCPVDQINQHRRKFRGNRGVSPNFEVFFLIRFAPAWLSVLVLPAHPFTPSKHRFGLHERARRCGGSRAHVCR